MTKSLKVWNLIMMRCAFSFNNNNITSFNCCEILCYLQFIDLCIMLGCDYTGSIKGVGPKRAIELIKNHRSLEKIIENIDTKKFSVPEDWNYKEARVLFQKPEVSNVDDVVVIMLNNFLYLLYKSYH